MKKILLLVIVSAILVITAACSAGEPVGTMQSYIGNAHVEGDDVFFEFNGTYYKAKNQKDRFEKVKGDYMTMIALSNGDYKIQENDKETPVQNPFSYETQKQKEEDSKKAREEDRLADEQRKQQLEDERNEHLRSLKKNRMEIEKARMEMKQDRQEKELEMERRTLETRLNSQ
ncbi:hypothetical protein ELQ35_02340 [Peribacillus cavernae]|uniref:Uncharacterized protein n=1 Tax=Peribacillus cavernae TaxID=1674310 RepID=A0A433HUR0_9BACI|nr:hypothetical protein [Peribacillus cavernae]MDQ0219987.1 membrane protein involved in colicin uptake [Peribacillus cavernae]RUQ32052.1 hypothetical protein ELQ35_02340 [Peribacillus cavernae]